MHSKYPSWWQTLYVLEMTVHDDVLKEVTSNCFLGGRSLTVIYLYSSTWFCFKVTHVDR